MNYDGAGWKKFRLHVWIWIEFIFLIEKMIRFKPYHAY